jgi:hypothetical protein
MLNRTLGTSSATRNGLNLGTLSNALVLGVLHGDTTLRVRSIHPRKRSRSMREGVAAIMGYPPFRGEPLPAIPGFSFPSSWWLTGPSVRPRSEVVAEAPPAVAEVIDDDRPCRADRSPVQDQPQTQRPDQVNEPKRTARAWSRAKRAVDRGLRTPATRFDQALSAACGRAAEG